VDKEIDTAKVDELNKLTKRTYWTASFAILIGLATVAVAISLGGSVHSVGISLGSLGIILGITSMILAATARKRRERIGFTMAKYGFWLSIVIIMVLVIAWMFTILSMIESAMSA
jgi:hypothetical protein